MLGSQGVRHATPGWEGQRTPFRVRPVPAELSPGWSKGGGGAVRPRGRCKDPSSGGRNLTNELRLS